MPSLTDELTSKAINDGSKGIQNSAKAAVKATAETLKTGRSVVKGICLLLLNGTEFTTKNVMNAVKAAAFKRTGDIKYAKNNIDIATLQKSGRVYKVEENITSEVMQHFDKYSRKYGIKYSAMKDERNPDKPAYMVFFEGKNSDMILHMMQEAYKDYMETEKSGKRESKQPEQPKRESVKAKLAFFRDRVAARDREQDVLEKHHSHSDIQR